MYYCLQTQRRGKIEAQLKAKKQEAAKWSREVGLLEKRVREQEVEMSKRKPLYIKAKEKTSHVLKRLEASKYVSVCNGSRFCVCVNVWQYGENGHHER